jgi:uncharacterized membrane protein
MRLPAQKSFSAMNIRILCAFLIGAVFIIVGIAHFTQTLEFQLFLPQWVPFKYAAVIGSGVLEIILGILVMTKQFRTMAAMAIIVVLVLYLPLHIYDLTRFIPHIGSKAMAWGRLPLQVLMIWMAYLAANWEKQS